MGLVARSRPPAFEREWPYTSGSRMIGSIVFVLRSTASTIVCCSTPSELLATTGRTWRRSGGSAGRKRFRRVRAHGFALERYVGVRIGDAVDDQFGVDVEGNCRRPRLKLCAPKPSASPSASHGAVEAFFEQFLEVGVVAVFIVTAAERVDAVEILCDAGPVAVLRAGGPGLGCDDDVAQGQSEERSVLGEVTDVDLETFWRVIDVDVPIINAAVNLDIAKHDPLGVGGSFFGEFVEAEYGDGAMPMLAERGACPGDALARDFPGGVEPVGIADHDDAAVFFVFFSAWRRMIGKVLGFAHAGLDLANPLFDARGTPCGFLRGSAVGAGLRLAGLAFFGDGGRFNGAVAAWLSVGGLFSFLPLFAADFLDKSLDQFFFSSCHGNSFLFAVATRTLTVCVRVWQQ